MSELQHRTVQVNGINMHIAEQGEGVPVVMCHGFPGLWYSWRNQLPVVADAGWKAVAPDLRGYGGTDHPAAVSEYGAITTAKDMTDLFDALGAEKVVLVGHDFGAGLVWDMALRHPERLLGVIVLSVPFRPRGAERPSVAFQEAAKAHFLHIHYFQEYGVADAELNGNAREFLTRVYWALSGAYHYLDIWQHPSEGNGYLDVLPPAPPLPWAWMSTEDMDYYVEQYTRAGFTGGLNWYRSMDLKWEESADLADAHVQVPTFFAAGANDCVIEMFGADPEQGMRPWVDDLRDVTLIPGAGHFVQMEAADQINGLMLKYLDALR